MKFTRLIRLNVRPEWSSWLGSSAVLCSALLGFGLGGHSVAGLQGWNLLLIVCVRVHICVCSCTCFVIVCRLVVGVEYPHHNFWRQGFLLNRVELTASTLRNTHVLMYLAWVLGI